MTPFMAVRSVAVIATMEDGSTQTVATSQLGRLNQTEGVQVTQNAKISNDDLTSSLADVTQTTTVTWVEQWVETRL